ncbi:DUF4391 domain-containing protein [Vibrio sp. Vb339]|uniref:DUF4391 domain-containing protein n=1 Tax=Vibrio sp. Vb339 TaxID=1192013 RepID=UPI001555F182|nr:DUF4391 domain-containing protein [Vibrio sp. Vb339]
MSNVIDFHSCEVNNEALFGAVYEHLALPDSTFLGTRITKKMILVNNDLSASDKKLVNEVVQLVEWVNTLKPETLNISTYVTETVEYIEVAVLKVILKPDSSNLGKLKNTAKLFHTLIPYPVILMIELDGQLAISLADKRINQSDSSKLVIEHFYNSQWFTVASLKNNQKEFLNDFTLKNVSSVNYYELYQDFISMLLNLEISDISGEYISLSTYTSENKLFDIHYSKNEDRKAVLVKIKELEAELMRMKSLISSCHQMKEKLIFNVKSKMIKDDIKKLKLQI